MSTLICSFALVTVLTLCISLYHSTDCSLTDHL